MGVRITLLGIISEVVLWTAILVVGSVLFGRYILPHTPWGNKINQEFTWTFNDVSQLSVGSPVNFMGIDVGSVKRLTPGSNHVKVHVETYPTAPKIPTGSNITVEFNGLAGAKTLEILPPEELVDAPENFIVEDPIRLSDVTHTQSEMSIALNKAAQNLAKSLRDYPDDHSLILALQPLDLALDKSGSSLSTMLRVLTTLSPKIQTGLRKTNTSIGHFNAMAIRLAEITRPADLQRRLVHQFESFHTTRHRLQNHLNSCQTAYLHDRLSIIASELSQATQSLNSTLPNTLQGWTTFNQRMCQVHNTLCRIDNSIDPATLRQRLHNFSEQLQHWLVPLKTLESKF
jgi:ABC-type transporter Mla subunit MlaD